MALPTKTDLLRLDFTYLGQPFCDVEAKTLNTQRLDFTFLGQPFIGVAAVASSLIQRRALYWAGSGFAQITDALVGTGKKPFVILSDGSIKERVLSEGTPIIWDSSVLRALQGSTETLVI